MVYQSTTGGCGKACVRDLLCLVFQEEAFSVQALSSPCEDFLEIRTELEKNGLTYLPYEIRSLDLVRKEQLPAIAQTYEDGKAHFVVVRRIWNKKVLVDDPAYGTYKLSMDRFLSVFAFRMLLKKTVGSKPCKPRLTLLKRSELALFVLFFLLQLASLLFMVYGLGRSETLPFSLLALVFFGVQMLAFLLFLSHVRRRLDDDILLPFVEDSREERDALLISSLLDAELKKVTAFFAYGEWVLLLLGLFATNGIFYTLLALLGVLFAVLDVLSGPERNRVSMDCQKEEARYFRSLGGRGGPKKEHFLNSQKMASRYLTSRLLLRAAEIAILSSAVLGEMFLEGRDGVNFFLFSFFLAVGVWQGTGKLLSNYLEDAAFRTTVNALSRPLPAFLLKRKLALGYTTTKGGRNEDGSTNP